MKKSIQKLSAITLAIATAVSTSAQEVKAADEYVMHMIGGAPVITVGTGGIPPEIYVRFYVKRGTHKRTNKRK